MMADSLEELHQFAASIGVKRHWFHKDHYDLRELDCLKALRSGAELVSSKKLVELRKK